MSSIPVHACWDSIIVRYNTPAYGPPYRTLVVEIVSLGTGRWSDDRFFYPYPTTWVPGAKLLILASTPLLPISNPGDDSLEGSLFKDLYSIITPTKYAVGVLS